MATVTFSAKIGNVPVELRRDGVQIMGGAINARRYTYGVYNAAGRQLGVLVDRTGPDSGRYVDPAREMEERHTTSATNWWCAMGHDPETTGYAFQFASEGEICGLAFPPAPVVLDDGRAPGWSSPGSTVATIERSRGFVHVTMWQLVTARGRLMTAGQNHTGALVPVAEAFTKDGRLWAGLPRYGNELYPVDHPVVQAASGIPDRVLGGNTLCIESDAEAYDEGMGAL